MTKKILLADDSVTIRKVVELTFMEEDYELESTADGRDAMSRLESSAPDLVIADVHMPEAGGFEVARESKRLHPEVPVLLLVGTFEPFDPDEVEESGADGFLKKPFDSQDLLHQVSKLLVGSPPSSDDGEDGPEEAADDEPSPEIEETPADDAEETAEVAALGEAPSPAEGEGAAPGALSDADVERIARKVAEILSAEAVREVAWEVVPDTAEIVIKERLRELESQVE